MRSIRSSWFVALVLVVGAGALPVAGSADTGPVPVDPPACVSVLPASWRELGVGVVSAIAAPGTYGGRDVQIAAAEFGLRSH